MTGMLAHPAAEELGGFVEGALDENERKAVVAHIADCDECRLLVVDAAEFIEPARSSNRHWWVGAAAAAVLLTSLGSFTHHEYRLKVEGKKVDVLLDAAHFATDALQTSIRELGGLRELERLFDQIDFAPPFAAPLSKVTESYGQLKNRPIDGRLSGFPYVPRRVMRGDSDETDLTLVIMQGDAANLAELHGNNARTRHARGLGLLLIGKGTDSIPELTAAAESEPTNASYQSDLAAALIATGHPDRALASCNLALAIDPTSADALFNRARALELLGRTSDAIKAYERYLAVDPSSPWAGEVRNRLETLKESAG
jgi:tetratricopeptide (TPR) repeat protein